MYSGKVLSLKQGGFQNGSGEGFSKSSKNKRECLFSISKQALKCNPFSFDIQSAGCNCKCYVRARTRLGCWLVGTFDCSVLFIQQCQGA